MSNHPYDDKGKQEWREKIYGILGACAPGPLLMLPGPKPHELFTAVSHGFSLEDIILIDKSPAILANLTREFLKRLPQRERPKMPPRKAGLLSERCRDLASKGARVNAACLDFNEPVETLRKGSPRVEIEEYVKSGIQEGGLLAVAVQNGRVRGTEGEKAKRSLTAEERREAKTRESSRFRMLNNAVSIRYEGTVTEMAKGRYFNSSKHTPMIWAIYRLDKRRDNRD